MSAFLLDDDDNTKQDHYSSSSTLLHPLDQKALAADADADADDGYASSTYQRSRASSTATSRSTAPPPYSEAAPSSSSSFSPSSTPSSSGTFNPTTHLQIHTAGVSSCSSLSCNGPLPIPVYRLSASSSSSSSSSHHHHHSTSTEEEPAYLSLRLKTSSNSCALIRGGGGSSSSSSSNPHHHHHHHHHHHDANPPINSTIYRWGPGRCPRIRLFSSSSAATCTIEQAIQSDPSDLPTCEAVLDVKSRNPFSRTQRMVDTPFGGTFQWRYGDRSEKKGEDANSLLILEKMEGKKEWRKVAQLVRNDEFRTPGTNRWDAGNGGRLMVDLDAMVLFGETGEKEKNEKKGAAEDCSSSSSSREKAEAFVVAGCICMLKREVDRMRDATVAAVT